MFAVLCMLLPNGMCHMCACAALTVCCRCGSSRCSRRRRPGRRCTTGSTPSLPLQSSSGGSGTRSRWQPARWGCGALLRRGRRADRCGTCISHYLAVIGGRGVAGHTSCVSFLLHASGCVHPSTLELHVHAAFTQRPCWQRPAYNMPGCWGCKTRACSGFC